MQRVSDWELLRALEASRAAGCTVAVHAENEDVIRAASVAAGRYGRERYGVDHPPIAEEEAVNRAIFLAGRAGGRLHIVHASSPAIVAQVRAAAAAGVAVTTETCPHYLAFSDADGRREGAWLKCSPPLRPAPQALWRLVEEGAVELVVSDHSPCLAADKRRHADDLGHAPNGFGGVQTLLPYMLTQWVARADLPPERLATLCCENPARFAGLFPRKGTLAPGSDADFVVVDMAAEWLLAAADLRCMEQWSPWVGERFTGRIRHVFIRGVHALADEEVLVSPGFGAFQPTQPNGAPATWARTTR
jgi:dihydroorotase-like cyclic amidohydrolase